MYAHKVGLDIGRWLEAISTGEAGSRSLELYEKQILEKDPTNQQEGRRRHSDGGEAVKKKILPSYDFQPILNLISSPTSGHAPSILRPHPQISMYALLYSSVD